MTENSPAAKDIYGCLVIGGGAAGLFFAAGEAVSGDMRIKGRKVILLVQKMQAKMAASKIPAVL